MEDYGVLDDILKEFQELHKEVFGKGYKQGLEDGISVNESYEANMRYDAYNKGLEEAWNIARKLYKDQGFSTEDLSDTFGTYYPAEVIKFYSIQEAKEKIDAWEKKKEEQDNEIRVGDEVERHGQKGIVTALHGYLNAGVLMKDGSHCVMGKDTLVKTGRSFVSDLSNLLIMIGEDEND